MREPQACAGAAAPATKITRTLPDHYKSRPDLVAATRLATDPAKDLGVTSDRCPKN